MRLRGKRVVVGVTGGIAVYKICELVRLLVKAGLEVNVIMTENAIKFVTRDTFRALTLNEVLCDVFEYITPERIEHVKLAQEADVFVVAPATANTIAKMVMGIADNMLTSFFLAYRGPVIVCPAMNERMYLHPVTQRNIKKLKEMGIQVLEPEEGSLACMERGTGRLVEVDVIFECIIDALSVKDFEGKNVVVTAGPTREHIDPVRFISNPSSGKMGYEIAKAAKRRGAEVTLISGPTYLKAPYGVNVVRVVSAIEMYKEVMERAEDADIIIMAAAVADYKPKSMAERKIKKEKDALNVIEIQRNPDILAELGKNKTKQYLVGFAAETHDLIENARDKLRRKNTDMIVGNIATRTFQQDTNQVVIVKKDGSISYLPEMSKEDVAEEILDEILVDIIPQ